MSLRSIISFIETVLMGRLDPNPQGVTQVGIGGFLQSVLHYGPLLARFGVAVAVWGFFAWLEFSVWPHARLLQLLAGFGFLAAEIYGGLLALRIFTDVLAYRHLGRFLKATWLPITVLGVAVYLLFVNDQGLELGIGLIDPDRVKSALLGATLIYWACNTWLAARIGLKKNFQQPARDQSLLFWGPRLLGVCAHLAAAFSLSVAAWKQPETSGILGFWLAVAAPAAILLATLFSWLLDKGYVSMRYEDNERGHALAWAFVVAIAEAVLVGFLIAAVLNDKQHGLSLAALFITVSALFFLIMMSVLRKERPLPGNAPAELRAADKDRETRTTARWTAFLAIVMVLATAAIWIWPMHVGQIFGSLAIACFAFGAFLALANLIDLLIDRLIDYASSRHFELKRPAVWLTLTAFLLVTALLASLSHPFHRVRLCLDDKCSPVQAASWTPIEKPEKRPSVSEAALAWYNQAEPAYHAVHPNEPVPMFIVATAGGGIRAAYWTATVMEALEARWNAVTGAPSGQQAPPESLLRNLLFAISGVSGGSVGAAAYAAAVHDHEVNGAAIKPTKYLQSDFLAPGLASMVFIDGPANLLPNFGEIDRGQALEQGFEAASATGKDVDGLVSHSFLSFFPTMEAVAKMHSWRPALLLNATHQETGRRIITSHLKIERGVIFDSYDALQVLNADIRLSTAAHNSARFTYVSPAGNLSSAPDARHPRHNRGYVIDGGYYENYGAETALELANKAIKAIDPDHQGKVKLVVLQISSDPTLQKDRTLVRVDSQGNDCVVSSFEPQANKSDPSDPANYLELIDPVWRGSKNEGEGYVLPWANELSAPFAGIMSVRAAHGTVAAEDLASASCLAKRSVQQAAPTQPMVNVAAGATGNARIENAKGLPHFAHLAMCDVSDSQTPDISPPLGWVLSKRTRDRFTEFLSHCGNVDELNGLDGALGLNP